MKITFKDIIWVAVMTLVVIYLSKCHRHKTDIDTSHINEITKKHQQDSVNYATDLLVLQSKLTAQEKITNEVIIQANISSAKLDASEATVNRLANAIRIAKLLPVDTSSVTVAPEYVDYCDSLAVESEYLTKEVVRYKNINTAIVAGKDGEIDIRDSIIAREHGFAIDCRARFADLQTAYKIAMEKMRPTNQVFIGAEILGTQNTFFQNIGAALTLKTKRNKLWQISSGIQSNGQVYARINGNILLSFK